MDIKALRTKFGYSIKELAAELGVNPSTVWRWEKGSNKPSFDQLLKLQALLAEESQES